MTFQTVETRLLVIGYETGGPVTGLPVILLHGWPDDIRTWDSVVPALHEAGFRTFRPYLRGFGPTRFQNSAAFRSGQLAALAQDLLDFADALGLTRFLVIGHDWGARAAYIASALKPERIIACTALSVGWGTNTPAQALSLKQAQNYWYHWLMALDRGAALVRDERYRFTHYIWEIWTPDVPVDEEAFKTTAASFDNPDWADITLHSYRVRWDLAPKDSDYADLEKPLANPPLIKVPTLTLHGGADPCNDPTTSAGKEALFSGFYERVILEGLGHFPQREAPAKVNAHLIPFLKAHGTA
ncbi:alpha/beta fold hydrolase [Beijerinckia indica]|uniref:Alpha/beta hydrolase fold n=1 Tax=Beijerinckia indica subsp. indica (strain ATCC 9039 / DSM 1715 / NCIMB 8712) TaxID=395963 RepID=B2IFA0_BEII9|nr:alpha/beta hydrolase [Beijerinckia indica]ACB95665.1 alpha/beta hydrolase fold [Beijerinckia indica subsp. indica ATCC 9039]